MINTTDSYKAAAKSDVDASVIETEFSFMPPNSKETATFTASVPAQPNTSLEQINNGVRKMGGKWGTFEQGRIKLDGSYEFIPENFTRQTGAWFAPLSGADGSFATQPTIEYTLNQAYDLIGVMVCFDELGREWATEIAVEFFNTANAVIASKTYTNNVASALLDLPANGVKKIKFIFRKWNVPNRFAKICQVYPGQIFDFTPDNTFDFQFEEYIKPFEPALTLPQFVINFDNSDKKFDIINPKGLVAFLRQKMKIKSSIIIGGEAVSTGNYFVYQWADAANDETAFLTCRPSMAFVNGYYQNAGRGTQTVAQACTIIMAGEVYNLETELQSIVVNQYIGDNVSLLDAMGQIAVACSGYWVFNRDSSYTLKKWRVENISNSIDYDIAFDNPAITQENPVTKINVKYYTYNPEYERLESNDRIVTLTPNNGVLKEISSAFIGNSGLAGTVANNALEYYKQRLKHSTSFKGDPSIQAGDRVGIENPYTTTEVLLTAHKILWSSDIITSTVEGVS